MARVRDHDRARPTADPTPAEFRHELITDSAPDRDPRMRRYWALAGEVTGERATVGTWLGWLLDALALVNSRPRS